MAVLIPRKLSPKDKNIRNSQVNTFSWDNTGDDPTNYQVIARRNSDNFIVYDSTVITALPLSSHDVPSNTFNSYLDTDLSWSVIVDSGLSTQQESNRVFFKAYSDPTVSFSDPNFSSPPVILPSQDYLFKGTYSQFEGLSLDRFRIILYDSTGINILEDSGEVLGTKSEFEFTGMERGGDFQSEFIAYPSGNLGEFSTGKLDFSIADYTLPDETPEIEATPDDTKGITTVDWANLIVLLGTSVGTTSYVTGKFNQGLQIDNSSSYLQFEYDVDGDDFTLSCYTKRKFNLDGVFIEADDLSPSLDMQVGFDLTTSRFYVIKDGVTTYGNIVVPNTLNFYSSQTLNSYSSQTFANLANNDYDDNFMFLFLTKDRLHIRIDTASQTFIDTFTYTRNESNTFSRFRFIGENIFDHIHMYNKEFTLTEIQAESTEVETLFGVNTSYLAKLDGTLDAGNITTGVTPTGWRVKRRVVGEQILTTLEDLPIGTNSYVDTTGANGVNYEYSVFTLSANGESLGQTDEAELSFYGVVITDGTNSYLIDAGWDGFVTDTVSHNKPYQVYSNNFAEKPIVTYAVSDYRTGGVKGILYQCIENQFIATTKEYFDEFKSFINNGTQKIYKDTIGNVIDVVTHDFQSDVNDKISQTYNEDIIQPHEVSFKWTEVDSNN